jgi:hypothetical protein
MKLLKGFKSEMNPNLFAIEFSGLGFQSIKSIILCLIAFRSFHHPSDLIFYVSSCISVQYDGNMETWEELIDWSMKTEKMRQINSVMEQHN